MSAAACFDRKPFDEVPDILLVVDARMAVAREHAGTAHRASDVDRLIDAVCEVRAGLDDLLAWVSLLSRRSVAVASRASATISLVCDWCPEVSGFVRELASVDSHGAWVTARRHAAEQSCVYVRDYLSPAFDALDRVPRGRSPTRGRAPLVRRGRRSQLAAGCVMSPAKPDEIPTWRPPPPAKPESTSPKRIRFRLPYVSAADLEGDLARKLGRLGERDVVNRAALHERAQAGDLIGEVLHAVLGNVAGRGGLREVVHELRLLDLPCVGVATGYRSSPNSDRSSRRRGRPSHDESGRMGRPHGARTPKEGSTMRKLIIMSVLTFVPVTALADDNVVPVRTFPGTLPNTHQVTSEVTEGQVSAPKQVAADPNVQTQPKAEDADAQAKGGYVVPQSTPYQGGRIPRGASIEKRPNMALIEAGAAIFGSAYGLSLLTSALMCTPGSSCGTSGVSAAWLYLPIVGPFIAASDAGTTGGSALAAFDGGVQLLGAAIALTGLLAPKKFVVWQDKTASIKLTPGSGASSSFGDAKPVGVAGLSLTLTHM